MNHPIPSTNLRQLIERNYQPDDDPESFVSKVSTLLATLSHETLRTEHLAAFDQFHARGLPATQELAELAGIGRAIKVLDAGSGLGGAARFLAETYGCEVVGVDLTPGFVSVAKMLTERMNLQDKVSFQVGNLTALPFAGGSFDVVWTQHTVMNIHAREQLYREVRRVLKTGGKFAFYDAVSADRKPPLIYPVPWAKTQETSCLLNQAETLTVFGKAGLSSTVWKDVSAESLAWFGQLPQTPPPPLSLAGLYGPEVRQWVGNFARNLQEDRIRLVMGICETTGA